MMQYKEIYPMIDLNEKKKKIMGENYQLNSRKKLMKKLQRKYSFYL
jgi:hypothetical protein